MSEYKINRLEQMPKVKEKAKPKSNLRMLIEQFDSESMEIAEIPLPEGKKANAVLIGIGRTLANQKRKDIEYFERADSKAIVLRKVKVTSKPKPKGQVEISTKS
jgi:hypothetical protein